MKKIICITAVIFTFASLFATSVDRYGIYIGANDGGKNREKLLYAVSDATAFKNTMSELGGIPENNSRLLVNPTKSNVDSAISEISKLIEKNKNPENRTEMIFYYSGHSDEEGLFLGNSFYDYSDLKQAISLIPSDIHVVILDSCYSGNFIRSKGGQKKKPFLVDDSSVVKGHAYLSSSSERESSQESDEIEASFFTNAVISGLRGAADTSGDKKVTLNELYSYAFNETLSKTEETKAGPQHPTYNITLVGSGDLILSDFSAAESMLMIGEDVQGRIIIRNAEGKLVSEINKTDSGTIMLAIPEGEYSATIIAGSAANKGEIKVSRNQVAVLNKSVTHQIELSENTLRGDSESETDNKIRYSSESSTKTTTSDENGTTTKTQENFNLKLNLEWREFKSDLNHDLQFLLSVLSTNGVVTGSDSKFNIKEDMSIPDLFSLYGETRIGLFGIKHFALGAALGTNFHADKNLVGGRSCSIGLSPGIGFHYKFYEDSPDLSGIFLYCYPVFDYIIATESLKSYWDLKSAATAGFCFTIGNISIMPAQQFLWYWKDGKAQFYSEFNLEIGFMLPGRSK